MAAVRVYIERSFAAILIWVDGSFKEPPPWKERKKMVQFSGALPAYAPPCFKKKKNLSP